MIGGMVYSQSNTPPAVLSRQPTPLYYNIWVKYEKIEKLGQGIYGKVYKAQRRDDWTIVAVKKTKFERGGVSASTVREVGLLKGLDHVNVVKWVIPYTIEGSTHPSA